MAENDVLYVLTTPEFFTEGPCGRVGHAIGFMAGVVASGKGLTLLSGPGAEDFMDEPETVRFRRIRRGGFWWPRLLVSVMREVPRHRVVVVRWRPILPFLLWPLLLLNRRFWFEVNSLTGLDSANPLARVLVRLSVWLTTRFFNLITVSEASMDRIRGLSKPCRTTHVMPNGFQPRWLAEFEPRSVPDVAPSLVYFGRKQPYYDWEMLYNSARQLIDEGVIAGVELFGFEEPSPDSSIKAHGEFDPGSLVRDLSAIPNPILIVHSSGSDMARATSPVKLFEYAALALPVVASCSMRRQASRLPAFRFYGAGCEQQFSSAVRDIASDYPLALQQAEESRRIALDHYTWHAVVRAWLSDAL